MNAISPNSPVLALPVKELPELGMRQFQEEIRTLILRGGRVLSLFGSPAAEPSRIFLNLASIENNGRLALIRCEHELATAYHSMSREFPLLHCFEREICEEFGLKCVDHPWLKPLRFSGEHQGRMSEYPFYLMEGKEVHEVGVGPIHAGVIEPGHFRFMCHGEVIHHLEIQLGYQHRGLIGILKSRDPGKLAPWIETVAGDTSIAHAWAYCQAWETLCGWKGSLEVDVRRGLALELERIAMHLSGLAGMSTDIAFLPGGSSYGRLRTVIINTSMLLCGSRFGRGWLRPGEDRSRLDLSTLLELRETFGAFRKDLTTINELFQSSKTVHSRLHSVGTLTSSDVRMMGFVGMVARSTAEKLDLRLHCPGALYAHIPIETVLLQDGDCLARAQLRIYEIDRSVNWIFEALEKLSAIINDQAPATKNSTHERLPRPSPDHAALSLVEGWRGEVLHYLETDDSGNLRHYHLQDPSLRNWFALSLAARRNAISDFPICNKSFDMSYCGHDL